MRCLDGMFCHLLEWFSEDGKHRILITRKSAVSSVKRFRNFDDVDFVTCFFDEVELSNS